MDTLLRRGWDVLHLSYSLDSGSEEFQLRFCISMREYLAG
jgi:hypothetical protein